MSGRDRSKVDLRKVWRYTARAIKIIRGLYPGYLTLSGLSSSIQALQPLTVLYLSARILDELSGARNVPTIIAYVSATVASTFLLSVARSAIERRLATLQSTFHQRMYFSHSEKYMEMDSGQIDKSSTNEMLADIEAKINGNSLGIPTVHHAFPRLVQRLFGLVASGALLVGLFTVSGSYSENLATSPAATVALATLVLLSMRFTFSLRQREQAVLKQIFERNPKTNSVMYYYRNYIGANVAAKDIRIYAQQPAISGIIQSWRNLPLWLGFFHYEGKVNAATAAANAVTGGCVYLFIGLRALAGMYGVGSVLRYVGAVSSLVDHATGLISECSRLVMNSPYLELAYSYLDLPCESGQGVIKLSGKPPDLGLELDFRNVSFKYPGSDTYALRNLSLKINIGRRLAIVGMNGSGKTTMIKLLCRLHEPTEGKITLNGIDIREFDLADYRSLFSVVFQDFKLFSLPLGQNVAASTDVDAARAGACLDKAGFSERLEQLPDGLDTCLYKDFDPDGVVVSGGEAQKIALARALYKDAPFIVLDEPTSALDPLAEFEVYSRFNEIIEDKTALYISHRLASCRICDDIVVFHDGRLIQRGNHESLLADKNGKYAELWNAQAQYYVVSSPAEKLAMTAHASC